MTNNASIGPTISIELDLLSDTTPQLGGNLDVNSNSIVSTSNGNITLAPNGSGNVLMQGNATVNGILNLHGNELLLDADGDTSITADTDDEIQIKLAGSDKIQITELAFMPQNNGSYMLGNSARRWHTIFGADINITGDITVTGNVDGRDVSADGTKLDGIEASADVTDTTNVVAALTAGTNVTIAGDGTISASGGGGGISTGKAIAMSMVFG